MLQVSVSGSLQDWLRPAWLLHNRSRPAGYATAGYFITGYGLTCYATTVYPITGYSMSGYSIVTHNWLPHDWLCHRFSKSDLLTELVVFLE